MAFDTKTWIQGQIVLLVQADLATIGDARLATEEITEDDRFWDLLGPMMRDAATVLRPVVATMDEDYARRRRGRGVS